MAIISKDEVDDERVGPLMVEGAPPSYQHRTTRIAYDGYGREIVDGEEQTPNSNHEQQLELYLSNLTTQIDFYRAKSAKAKASPSNANLKAEAEKEAAEVSSLMHNIAELQSNPKKKSEWHRKADEFEVAKDEDREGILEEIGRGLLMLLVAPLALAGAGLYAAGEILGGVGKILKGFGRLGKVALDKTRKGSVRGTQ